MDNREFVSNILEVLTNITSLSILRITVAMLHVIRNM